jgi:hypothetical protein
MAERLAAAKILDVLVPLAEHVADKAGMALRYELRAVIADDSRRFLSAMLKGMESERHELSRVGIAEDAENPAFLVEFVVEGCFGKRALACGHGLPASPLPVD